MRLPWRPGHARGRGANGNTRRLQRRVGGSIPPASIARLLPIDEILGVVSQENIDVVSAFVQAFNSGDVDRMEALCTDNSEIAGIRSAIEETEYVGQEAVRRFWADATEIWSKRRFDVEAIESRGDDTVIVLGTWHGRGRASGVDVERQLEFRFRLEAGRIASLRTVINSEAAGE